LIFERKHQQDDQWPFFNSKFVVSIPKCLTQGCKGKSNYPTKGVGEAMSKSHEITSPCLVPIVEQELSNSRPHKFSDVINKKI
jgi:hypothetical protein